jgi:DNA-binding transcriptional LysR family regulator
MRGSDFVELTGFAAVAERGSFAKAAAVLGISTSTLSQAVRSLEERLGVRLFNRTTRSVALTEAGERLFRQIGPVLEQLEMSVEAVNSFRDRPTGTLRLTVCSLAVGLVIGPNLGAFQAAHPDITLDITVDDGVPDLVAGHFDAGIQPHWRIERDMIATRISPASRLIAVASPEYLSRHPRPVVPKDLSQHNCVRFRRTTGAVLRWRFERDGEKIEVPAEGSVVTNNFELAVCAAVEGIGIGYTLESYVARLTAEGRLVPVLEDWTPHFNGFHIYYPSRRQLPMVLRAFIDFLRHRLLVS